MNLSFSFWEQETLLGSPQNVVVGAGIVGLSAAIHLKMQAPGERVVVLDRSPIGAGGSTRNAGFACFGSPTEILADLNTMTEQAVVELIRRRYEGLQLLRTLLGDTNIGYLPTGSYELFTAQDAESYHRASLALERLNSLLHPITQTRAFEPVSREEIERRFAFERIYGALSNPLEGTIDTGLMMRNLRLLASQLGVELYGGLDVRGWEEGEQHISLHGDGFTLQCQRLLICTNGFAAQLLPDLDVTPARNLVLVSEPIPSLNWEGSFHMYAGYVYFRNIGKRLLIGGARHLDTEWHTQGPVPDHLRNALAQLVNTYLFPHEKVVFSHEWMGYLGVGATREPLVGRHSDRVSYAVRMGGMGVAIGSAVGRQLAELALELSDPPA